jgi:hypothetical protein
MNTMKVTVSALAITWFIASLSACVPAGNMSDQASRGNQDAAQVLTEASNKLASVLNNAGVMAVGQGNNMGNGTGANSGSSALPADCSLTSTQVTDYSQTRFFKDLQQEIEAISQNVQSQDFSQLSTRFQGYQNDLMADINDVLGEIEKCIPADAAQTGSLPSGINLPQMPQIPQMGSLPSGINLPQLGSNTIFPVKTKK